MKRIHSLLSAIILASTALTANAQQYKTNGNLFEGTPAQITMSDKQRPATLNGEKLYSHSLMATAPQYRDKDTTLRFYILSNLKADFNNLPDGIYNFNLTDIVVDKEGRIVYSRYGGVEMAKRKGAAPSDDVQLQIETKLRQILATMPPLIPARKNEINVPFIFSSLPPAAAIEVKNHNARVF
jgi:hypothetical protein